MFSSLLILFTATSVFFQDPQYTSPKPPFPSKNSLLQLRVASVSSAKDITGTPEELTSLRMETDEDSVWKRMLLSLLLFDPPPSLDGLGGRPSAPQVASHRGRCVGCMCMCVCVEVGEPGGAMAQGGTLAVPPKRTGMWEAFRTPAASRCPPPPRGGASQGGCCYRSFDGRWEGLELM